MSKVYEVLIVGLGNIGFLYDFDNKQNDLITTHAKAFEKHKNFKIIGGVDLVQNNRIDFEKTYKVKTFENIEEALTNLKPDIIVISTSTVSHNICLKKILEKGIKNSIILCEKPISDNIGETENLLKNLKALNNYVYVNYMRRADPGVLEIKRRIDNGEIKLPIKGVCYYTNGVYNNGSHLLDLCIFLFGQAKNTKLISENIYISSKDPYIDFHINFANASVTFLNIQDLPYSVSTAEFYSKSGRLYYENEGRKISFYKDIKCPIFEGYRIIQENGELIKNEMNISQYNVVKELLKAIEFKETKLCTSLEALYSLKLINNTLNDSQK